MTERDFQDSIERGHEPPTFDTRRVLIWVAALVVLIVCAALLMFGLLRTFQARRPAGTPLPGLQGVDSARVPLDATQAASRLKYEQRQQHLLTSYGWVDQPQGIVRIPIDRAMRLYQQQNQTASEQP